MAASSVSQRVEDNLRTLAQTKRIRVTEFFQDFDKLRSGFITEPQFFRCLWQTLGVQLNPNEEVALREKYDLYRSGRVNYKRFCQEIDGTFNPGDLTQRPAPQQPLEFLGTIRSVRPLSTDSETRLVEVLKHMMKFYQYHGVNLKTCFEDFDRHHIGVITESQFYRSFPGPPDVSEADMNLLVTKYRDPERPGVVNYLNLHKDIMSLQQMQMQETQLPPMPRVSSIDFVPLTITADPTLNQIFDRIRVAVYKSGIRTIEFFKDHDKLRSGMITENQFVCGLALAVGKEAQLSRPEIQKVVEFYRQPDGRIKYKEFCDIMENAFNIPDLDKKPTQEAVRPPKGALSRGLKELSAEEDQRVEMVLRELSDNVRRRRLMMYPYFKDYDRGIAYTRVVTKTQFGRILHFLSLNVAPEDLKLLCRKFEDPGSGDVNYPAFVQAVDQEFVGHTLETVNLQDEERTNQPVPDPVVQDSEVSYEDLMARIRHHVLTNRLRVKEYFEDYDPLQSNCISKSQFRRGLGLLGLSKLGAHDLIDGQFKLLCDMYENPAKTDQVYWTRFMDDVESVFTEPNLEKSPTYKVPPSEMFQVPKPGSISWESASDDHKSLYEETMERLRQRAGQRRLLAKPVFQDFDRHTNHHVTRSQFRQCLTMLELHTTEAEVAALEARFCNDVGFNYQAFLDELQPPVPPQLMYVERLKTLRLTNQNRKLPELNPAEDLEEVLLKLKTKVFKARLRVLDFLKDYDKLRSGRMLKTSFRRALDLAGFELKESEVSLLEDKYESRRDPDYIDYLAFSDELESIFTVKDLEKAPLQETVQFQPPVEWELNVLPADSEAKFQACMAKIAEKVRKHRMQLFPLFEDYDRVHNGAVSRFQFRRVLTELELGSMVSQEEFQLLWQKFDIKIGGKDDVNYIAFCDFIYKLAGFEPRKP
ncbi:EF-hand calcium-binding domain-containing protein 6-like [Haliotis cracherodii]|uniref:EF-hand calcium-binding domain-containing protein 6-like n=1 Tax=Haliotis cracherodii TaxID=6455 RepID=UPI0039E7C4B9